MTAKKDIKEPSKNQIVYISKDKLLPFFGLFFLVCSAYLLFIIYYQYFWPAFLAFVIYIGFYSFHSRVVLFFTKNKTTSASHFRAAIFSTSLATMLILIPSIIIVKQVIGELFRLIDTVQNVFIDDQWVTKLENVPLLIYLFSFKPFIWVEIYKIISKLTMDFNQYMDPSHLKSWLGNIFEVLGGGVGFTLHLFFNLLVALVVLFFLFKDGHILYIVVRKNLPFPYALTNRFYEIMQKTISDLLKGNILVSVMQGAFISFAFFLLGFENIFSYGFLAAIFSVLPLVGTSPIWLPATFYVAFIENRPFASLVLAIYSLSVFVILENFVRPKLIMSKLQIHPVFIFFAIMGGLFEFGITGVFLGPLCVVLSKTIWDIYHVWDSNEMKK